VCVCVSLDDNFGMKLPLSQIYDMAVHLLRSSCIGQGHRPKFKVTGGNCPLSAESESELGKLVPEVGKKSRPELETK